jgi:hypothetical protein
MKKLKPVETDMERLIRLSEAARMLGISAEDMRTSYAAAHGLTVVDQSRPGAQRRRLFLVLGEVLDHRRNLIDQARRRTDVTGFLRK